MKKSGFIALALAVAAGVSNYIYAENLRTSVTGGKTVNVAVTVNSVKKGEIIQNSNIGFRKIPLAYIDSRYITQNEVDKITGLKLAINSAAGQIIAWTDFEHRDDAGERNLATYVKAGKRAMTIPVNSSLSLGGLLQPGHRVDIIGTFTRTGNDTAANRSITLLQNITVLATGDKLGTDSSSEHFSTVTLGVTLEQSELLSFASQSGSLSVVLRGHQDLSITRNVPPVGAAEIFVSKKLNAIQKRKHSDTIERLKEIK
jgi:pilus assembly protein CpaB